MGEANFYYFTCLKFGTVFGIVRVYLRRDGDGDDIVIDSGFPQDV